MDLAGLDWADPSLMLDFVMLARRLRARGNTIAFWDAQPQIALLLELVGLDRLPGIRIERSAAAPGSAAPIAALA